MNVGNSGQLESQSCRVRFHIFLIEFTNDTWFLCQVFVSPVNHIKVLFLAFESINVPDSGPIGSVTCGLSGSVKIFKDPAYSSEYYVHKLKILSFTYVQ